jgi:CO dehydrogenase nickel-insertion accessory protein CooC1
VNLNEPGRLPQACNSEQENSIELIKNKINSNKNKKKRKVSEPGDTFTGAVRRDEQVIPYCLGL